MPGGPRERHHLAAEDLARRAHEAASRVYDHRGLPVAKRGAGSSAAGGPEATAAREATLAVHAREVSVAKQTASLQLLRRHSHTACVVAGRAAAAPPPLTHSSSNESCNIKVSQPCLGSRMQLLHFSCHPCWLAKSFFSLNSEHTRS